MLETFVASHSTSLDDFDAPRTLSEWSPNTFLPKAQSLKFASLCDTSIVDYRPPLDTVVHLRLESYSNLSVRYDSTALDSILSLPRLKALSIRGPLFEIASTAHDLAVEARSLEHFRCDSEKANGSSISVGEYFVSCVDGPLLQSLTLEGCWASTRLQHPAKRYPSLKTLVLRQQRMRDSDVPFVVDIFSTAPTIRQLVWSTTGLLPFARALAESGVLTLVQEVIIDGKLDNPPDDLALVGTAFPNLSTIRVSEAYVELLDTDKLTGRPIQIKSLGPPTPVSHTGCWGDADSWPSRVDAQYLDWGSFDFHL